MTASTAVASISSVVCSQIIIDWMESFAWLSSRRAGSFQAFTQMNWERSSIGNVKMAHITMMSSLKVKIMVGKDQIHCQIKWMNTSRSIHGTRTSYDIGAAKKELERIKTSRHRATLWWKYWFGWLIYLDSYGFSACQSKSPWAYLFTFISHGKSSIFYLRSFVIGRIPSSTSMDLLGGGSSDGIFIGLEFFRLAFRVWTSSLLSLWRGGQSQTTTTTSTLYSSNESINQ